MRFEYTAKRGGPMRKRVAVIFGGRSLEHDVSIISAMQVLSNIDKNKYIVEPIYMRDGDFFASDVDRLEAFGEFDSAKHKKLILYSGEFFALKKNRIKKFFRPDVALVVCHGGEGENGNLQAMLEMNGVPFTSPYPLQSAICMDKEFSKRVFENMLLSVLPFETATRNEYFEDKDKIVFMFESLLSYPLIVKPARLGSSIGIGVAKDRAELKDALDIAFTFDDKVVVEHKLDGFVEVNCAAYSSGDEIVVGRTEQPVTANEFLTFADKYERGGKMSELTRISPADIGSLNLIVKAMTERIYRDFDMNGIIRVDYLVDVKRGKVYVNEINTVPGSLAFYLFDTDFKTLLDEVISAAIKRGFERKSTVSFKTEILSKFKGGQKLVK